MSKTKFNPGDKVVVARDARSVPECCWSHYMNYWRGERVTISETDFGGPHLYALKEDTAGFSWHESWLKREYARSGEPLIHFEGETATAYRKMGDEMVPEKTVDISHLMSAVIGSENVYANTPVLPPGARYYEKNGYREIIVVEHPPRERTVLTEGRRVRLAFPYILYFFFFVRGELSNSKLFYRDKPFLSLDDRLFISNLNHVFDFGIYSDLGNMCIPYHHDFLSNRYDYEGYEGYEGQISVAMRLFWESEFNLEKTGGNWEPGIQKTENGDERFAGVDAWAEASKKDPLFATRVAWKPAFSVREVLCKMFETGNGSKKNVQSADELMNIMYQI